VTELLPFTKDTTLGRIEAMRRRLDWLEDATYDAFGEEDTIVQGVNGMGYALELLTTEAAVLCSQLDALMGVRRG
jgi:hypothetical protein